MKFYTQELLDSFGSADDHIAAGAQRDWEVAADRYVAQLQSIRPQLPSKVREFLDRFDLHDATVVNLGQADSEFYISLLLDSPAREWLTLRYKLAKGMKPELVRHDIGPEDQTPVFQWLYDEVDITTTDGVTVVSHSILFTNGIEVRLLFNEMDFTVATPWLARLGGEMATMPISSHFQP